MRGVEDDFAADREIEPFAWVEELCGCVFDAAVGGGDVHLGRFICCLGGGVGEGEEIEVHLCGEAFSEVAGGEPAGERDEVCGVDYSVALGYPGGEGDGFGVDGFAAGFEVGGGEGEEGGGGGIAVVGEEDAAFFETFADGGVPVGKGVDVAGGRGGWGEGTVLGGDVAAGEDVGGGEGGGCADAVEEEDAVCGGYEEDAGGGLVCAFGL